MRKLLLLLILVNFACTPVYIPNSRSVPAFERAGELSLDGYAGSSGFDINTGLSVSDHVAIIANASYGEINEQESEDFHTHKFGEIGVGYFNNTGSKLQTEIYGGYGIGEATSVDDYIFISSNQVEATGSYNRAFIQSNVLFSPGEGIIQLGGAFRLTHVTFTEFETSATVYNDSRSATFAEPIFFFRVGDPIHFNLQTGFNVPLDGEVAFDYRLLHVSFGVGAKINLTKKDKASTN
ncbi:MAG: hypothetical protein ABJH05_06155 [Fulvivirga sp.]